MLLSREYYVLIMITYNWNIFMTLILTDIVRLFLTLIKKYIVLKQWIIYLHLRSRYFYLENTLTFMSSLILMIWFCVQSLLC